MSCNGIWEISIPKCPKCGSRIWVRVSHEKWRCIVCGYEVELEWKVRKG
jgi:DNA-directed RNA polymerase subunit RPC12/RpoP